MTIEQIKILIKEHFKNSKSIQKSNVQVFLNQYPEIQIQLHSFLQENPLYLSIRNIVCAFILDIQLNSCKICGKIFDFNETRAGKKYCSIQCQNNDAQLKLKMKMTRQQTCMKKYGVKSSFLNPQTRQKIKKTNMERYGVDLPIKNEKIKQRLVNTMIEKYGVTNIFNYPQIRKSIIQKTNFQLRNKHTQETCMRKYGVKSPQYLVAWNSIQKWKQHIIPLFQLSQYQGANKEYKWKCVKCGNIFYQKIYGTSFHPQFQDLPRCLNCYPFTFNGKSSQQIELINFCKQFYPNLLEGDRTLIKPYQVDILITQINLAIEFNGLFWHDINHVQPNYHLMKTQMCQQQGYRLIHIWQNDWNERKEQIKDKLKAVLTNTEKIIFQENFQLNRDWYFKQQINGFILTIEKPIIENINGYSIEKCGKLIYKKIT